MAIRLPDREHDDDHWTVSLRSSLIVHWLLSSALLLCLIPIIGFENVWSADVGAQLAQSQQLADGGGWFFSNPFPEADLSGDWFTYHLSGRVDNRYVVLAKHPAFTWIVAGLLKVGGYHMVMAFSVFSTSTAAFGVGVLVRKLASHRTAAAALWLVATLSPLAFDGFLGYAHSFAAALGIWSMVSAVAFIQSGSLAHAGLPIGCALATAGPFVRSEAILLGVALGLALLATSGRWWTVSQRRFSYLAGALTVLSTGVGFVIDDVMTVKADRYIGDVAEPVGWLPGRFQGFGSTWLYATASGWRSQDLLLVAVPVCWFLAGRAFGRPGPSAERLLFAGAALVAVWWVLDPQHIVPGLLLAFPLLVLLVGLARTETIDDPIAALGLAAFVLFAGAVILTQYSQGGTSEWGGRYFAAGIPLAITGFSPALARLADEPRPRLLRRALPTAVASLLLISTGLGGLRQSKQLVGQLGSSVETLAASNRSDSQHKSLVVVSTSNAVSRLLWQQTALDPWLLVPPDELDQAMGQLDQAGVERVIVIAERHQQTNRAIGSYVDVEVVEPWSTSPVEILAFHAE